MIHRSKETRLDRVVYELFMAIQGSFESEKDGCTVTRARCQKCNKVFEEELEVAKTKIIEGQQVLCLSCDGEGGEIRDIRVVRALV